MDSCPRHDDIQSTERPEAMVQLVKEILHGPQEETTMMCPACSIHMNDLLEKALIGLN